MPPGKAKLAEQNIAELLGAAGIDRLAGDAVDLGFEAGGLLGEFAGQPRQHLSRSIEMPRRSMSPSTRNSGRSSVS